MRAGRSERFRAFEKILAGAEYACAGRFTIADISVGYAIMLASFVGLFDDAGDAPRLFRTSAERPAFRRAKAAQKRRRRRRLPRRCQPGAATREKAPQHVKKGRWHDAGHRTGQLVPSTRAAHARAQSAAFRRSRTGPMRDAAAIEECAERLAALGVDKGDRVAFLGLNQPMFFFSMFGPCVSARFSCR